MGSSLGVLGMGEDCKVLVYLSAVTSCSTFCISLNEQFDEGILAQHSQLMDVVISRGLLCT